MRRRNPAPAKTIVEVPMIMQWHQYSSSSRKNLIRRRMHGLMWIDESRAVTRRRYSVPETMAPMIAVREASSTLGELKKKNTNLIFDSGVAMKMDHEHQWMWSNPNYGKMRQQEIDVPGVSYFMVPIRFDSNGALKLSEGALGVNNVPMISPS